jgi:flagellar motor component MotA
MTFSGGEIRAAIAHAVGAHGGAAGLCRSALFWEAAARNFWLLGVSRSLLSFVISLGSLAGGLGALASGLANSLLAAVYGIVLAVICYVPHWKLEERRHRLYPRAGDAAAEPQDRRKYRRWGFGHIAGYFLFAAVLASTLLRPPGDGIQAAVGWIVHGPSLLVVYGGTLALLLFLGDTARASSISPGFALTGLIGSLMGFVQALLGMSSGDIERISSGLTFILSSCFAALLGMILVGGPLEDRAAGNLAETGRTPLGRAAWYVFPLLALVFLVAVFILIVTPFEKHT